MVGRSLQSSKIVVSLHTVCVETNDVNCEAFQGELQVQGALKFTAEGRHEKSGFKWLLENFSGATFTEPMKHKLGKDGNVDIPANPASKTAGAKKPRPPAAKKQKVDQNPELDRQRRRDLRSQRKDVDHADQGSELPPQSSVITSVPEGALQIAVFTQADNGEECPPGQPGTGIAFAAVADDESGVASPCLSSEEESDASDCPDEQSQYVEEDMASMATSDCPDEQSGLEEDC